MPLNKDLFIHESDKNALKALKAIPGFTPLLKAFMNVWNERMMRVENMSTNLRLGENQLRKYYRMLPPICEKLGIEVPELYLQLDVNPNAYTSGDNHPFIVITSGLIETIPEHLIPTVLAHECGHILCHHVLYHSMGRALIQWSSNALSLTPLGDLSQLITTPILVAFMYWMRCSEFSADRVAAVYDGTSDNIVEMCMRFAGYDKDIIGETSTKAFLEQAEEYRQMTKDSKYDKLLEFIQFWTYSHPLNAVRALDCKEWSQSEQFQNVVQYVDEEVQKARLIEKTKYIYK